MARKGRALVISISKFATLPPLEGYVKDEAKLLLLWDQIGFDVFTPRIDENRCLTAQVRLYNIEF